MRFVLYCLWLLRPVGKLLYFISTKMYSNSLKLFNKILNYMRQLGCIYIYIFKFHLEKTMKCLDTYLYETEWHVIMKLTFIDQLYCCCSLIKTAWYVEWGALVIGLIKVCISELYNGINYMLNRIKIHELFN